MFERFTDPARRALILAQEEARFLRDVSVGTEHILLGLLKEGQGVAAGALQSLGISVEAVRAQLQQTSGPEHVTTPRRPAFTSRARRALELAAREASRLGRNSIDTEHVLLGVLLQSESGAARVLLMLGTDPLQTRRHVVRLLTASDPGSPEE